MAVLVQRPREMPRPTSFAFVGFQDGSAEAESRRIVRSQAMKDFRKRQKEAKRKDLQQRLAVRSSRTTTPDTRHSSNGTLEVAEAELSEASTELALAASSKTIQARKQQALARLLERSTSPYKIIDNRFAQREALVPIIAKAVFPQNGAMSTKNNANHVARWLSSEHPAAQGTTESVGLLFLASSTGDERILHQGRQRFLSSIRVYRNQLTSSAGSEGMRVAAQAIMFCEIFNATGSDAQDSSDHVNGMVMAHIGDRRWKDMTSAEKAYVKTVKLWAGIEGLVSRKAGLNADMSTSCADIPGQSAGDAVENLIMLCTRVPGLLEMVDVLKAQPRPPAQAVHRARFQAEALLSRLRQCYASGHAGGSFYAPSITPMHAALSGNSLASPEVLDGPFATALMFTTYFQANIQTLYCSCVLLVVEALIDLQPMACYPSGGADASNELATTTTTHRLSVLHEVATSCADVLARTTPYLVSVSGASVCAAMACRSPLHFAGKWYERSGDVAKRKWCTAVEDKLKRDVPFLRWQVLLAYGFLFAFVDSGYVTAGRAWQWRGC